MRLTIFLLLFSLSAQGQFIIDSYRFGAAGLLLDDYPNAEAAYSLRLLRTAYTGDCIIVRRSNDNALDTIGFLDNYLDTATMKTFCGANNCFVSRLYDQSGNGRDFVQATNASQPAIITSGTVLRDNGEVSLRFDGSNDWMEIPSSTAMFDFIHDGGDATFFTVQRFGSGANPGAYYTLLNNNGTSGANIGFHLAYNDESPSNDQHQAVISRGVGGFNAATMVENNRIPPNAIGLLYTRFDADNATAANRVKGAINGGTEYGSNTLTNAPSSSNATHSLTIGALSNPASRLFPLLGAVQEIIIYNADQSSNRTAIETNINNFYLIY
jgi:hypothetical protein